MKICMGPYEDEGEREIKVEIEPYDTWSLDHTLAFIIHPLLIQLKETKHGAPYVDDEDVPEHLRSTAAVPKENDVDSLHFDRWDWILDEMIWAFEQSTIDDEEQFHHNLGNLSMKMEDGKVTFGKVDPDKPAHYFDREAYAVHQQRKQNGRKLFAKYYESLWD
jgi:hypothetical protein